MFDSLEVQVLFSTRWRVHELAEYLRGWIGYFGRCETPDVLDKLGQWIRRRLRSMVWKQGKQRTTRYRELRKRGIIARKPREWRAAPMDRGTLQTPQR
jgi:hypothetical protein